MPRYRMSFSTLIGNFAGNIHGEKQLAFEAASDELAIKEAKEIASQEHWISGDYKLEEYREIGIFPKPERVAA